MSDSPPSTGQAPASAGATGLTPAGAGAAGMTAAGAGAAGTESTLAVPAADGPAYETGVARVEEIIHRLDSGIASLGETLELIREGKGLIERCAGELEAVGGALEELRLEELVARLEGGGE
jgi:exodeoxyribonuclease VII small subunit